MSRDQSINKIAPHVTTAFAAVEGVRKVKTDSFSPYFVDAKEQHSENKQDKQQKESSALKKQSGPSVSDKNRDPEIFTLIANPDFSDFFALSLDRDGHQLMYIVKKVREERGVTTFLPISKSRKPGMEETNTYLNTHAHFAMDKGERFTTEI